MMMMMMIIIIIIIIRWYVGPETDETGDRALSSTSNSQLFQKLVQLQASTCVSETYVSFITYSRITYIIHYCIHLLNDDPMWPRFSGHVSRLDTPAISILIHTQPLCWRPAIWDKRPLPAVPSYMHYGYKGQRTQENLT